jgi:hypothetical protein
MVAQSRAGRLLLSTGLGWLCLSFPFGPAELPHLWAQDLSHPKYRLQVRENTARQEDRKEGIAPVQIAGERLQLIGAFLKVPALSPRHGGTTYRLGFDLTMFPGHGQRVDLRSHTHKKIGTRPPETPRRGSRPVCGPTINVVPYRPYLVATCGQTVMIMLPLRQRAVATFNRRGGPLERSGVLTGPRFPARQHLGLTLSGAWMPLTGVCNRLEHESDWDPAVRTARVAKPLLPVHQQPQQLPNPRCPHRGHGHGLHVLTPCLPPAVHQGRDVSARRADLIQGVLFQRYPVGLTHRFDRLALGSHLAFHVL